MKRDGRSFDHRTLEAIRLMAVERVRDGERPSSVIASFGFNRTTIYRWLEAASKPGIGLWGLRSRALSARLESQGIPSESRMGESPSVVPCHRFAFWGANAEAVFAGLAWTGD